MHMAYFFSKDQQKYIESVQADEMFLLEFLIEGILIYIDEVLLTMKGNNGPNVFDGLGGILRNRIDAIKKDPIMHEACLYLSCFFSEGVFRFGLTCFALLLTLKYATEHHHGNKAENDKRQFPAG
jgi:hypothetical protein